MGKSILDQALSSNEEERPSDIAAIFADVYSTCKYCQEEYDRIRTWVEENPHVGGNYFHWSIVCCEKHTEWFQHQLRGYVPPMSTTERILVGIEENDRRIDTAIGWFEKTQKEIEKGHPEPRNFIAAEQEFQRIIYMQRDLLAELYYYRSFLPPPPEPKKKKDHGATV